MRSAQSRPVTVGLATGLFVITSGVTGTVLAASSPTATAPATASAAISSAATQVASSPSATQATSSPSATQATTAPTAAASSPTAASSTPIATPTATGTGLAGSITSATSPAATATPTPTPTPTPSTSTSATPAPAAAITVTASTASAQPGATILFRISAYTNLSASATGKITSTLTPSVKTPAFAAPAFTVDSCTTTSGTTCTLSVPTAKPSQPQVETQITVPKSATAGETVKYSATVTVTDGSSTLTATANAPTITVAKAAASPSATSTPEKKQAAAGDVPSAGSTVDLPGLSGTTGNVGTAIPLGALPAVAGVSTTIPAGNASTLFPQINPSAAPSPAAGTQAATPEKAQPVADSSRIPLSLGSSEFGAQIVGLIVLLLGVAIAVTRLSVRKTRPGGK